jgi:hypothetical protein
LKPAIWKLHECANDYCSFIPSDLRFFERRFQCQPLTDEWDVPPAAVDGKSKPLADFVSWMSMAPVVSERAAELIADLVGEDVELLRFHKLKAKPYFVMNVLRCEDYLDKQKSDFTEPSESFVFRSDIPTTLPPIFKCPGRWDEVFVTRDFAEMMVANKLRGAALADPAEPTFPLILAKASVNRYPGLEP